MNNTTTIYDGTKTVNEETKVINQEKCANDGNQNHYFKKNQDGMKMKSKLNTTEKIKLSINKAVEIISKHTINILVNNRTKPNGDNVFYSFDKITIDKEVLTIGRENCSDKITFALKDITDNIYLADEAVHFSLTNGEEWIITLCGEVKKHFKPHEKYEEIEADEVIDKLKKCKKVSICNRQQYFESHCSFDSVNISDTGDDMDWEGDREIKVKFQNSQNTNSTCEINIDEYDTKYYIAREYDEYDIIYIYLCDTPFSSLLISLFYKEN